MKLQKVMVAKKKELLYGKVCAFHLYSIHFSLKSPPDHYALCRQVYHIVSLLLNATCNLTSYSAAESVDFINLFSLYHSDNDLAKNRFAIKYDLRIICLVCCKNMNVRNIN